jgi:hypothetical protein
MLAMDWILLEPPFDRQALRQIGARARRGWRDLSHTIGWLMEHPTSEAITESLGLLWAASSLPLSRWIADVEGFRLCTNEDRSDLRIGVLFGRAGYPRIMQRTPLTVSEYSRATAAFPCPLPGLVREVALTAPGLSLGDTGELFAPEDVSRPMSRMRRWVLRRNITPELCARYGCVFSNDQRFLMEVADNGQGCWYVIDRKGRLYYHEYGDLPGLIPCTISFDGFVRAYFEDPGVMLNPYKAGWAVYPQQRNEAGT